LRPASQRVWLYRGAGAPALVRTIVLTWSPPVYRPDVHLSEGRLASLYAWRRFLRMNFVELRKSEVRLLRIPFSRTPLHKGEKKDRGAP
jgi:hypothetical protein